MEKQQQDYQCFDGKFILQLVFFLFSSSFVSASLTLRLIFVVIIIKKYINLLIAAKIQTMTYFLAQQPANQDVPVDSLFPKRGTWQTQVTLFLQKRLNLLNIYNPHLVQSSYEVFSFLDDYRHEQLNIFFIDIKDLYYSLPNERLLKCVKESLDAFGVMPFMKAAGRFQNQFLDLLKSI